MVALRRKRFGFLGCASGLVVLASCNPAQSPDLEGIRQCFGPVSHWYADREQVPKGVPAYDISVGKNGILLDGKRTDGAGISRLVSQIKDLNPTPFMRLYLDQGSTCGDIKEARRLIEQIDCKENFCLVNFKLASGQRTDPRKPGSDLSVAP